MTQSLTSIRDRQHVQAHLAPMRRPDIDGAVRTLCRGMVLPEGMRMIL